MLKDFYNEIIPPWDSRYGKLGHLYKRYNDHNTIKGSGQGRKYYIPSELVLEDKITHRGNRILRNPDIEDNYASANSFENLLMQSCYISMQEYVDIIYYHNNSRINRPRCYYCKSYLIFQNRINRCYGEFCSSSCSVRYSHSTSIHMYNHSLMNITGLEHRVKSGMKSLLAFGDPNDIVSIYIVETDTTPKFGVAKNIDTRISFSNLDGTHYRNILLDVRTTRLKAAHIEAVLKLQNNGSEWIYNDEIELYTDKINDLLDKPTTDPFE